MESFNKRVKTVKHTVRYIYWHQDKYFSLHFSLSVLIIYIFADLRKLGGKINY